MHTRMGGHGHPDYEILKSQFHRNVRVLRARIIRGKKMKQMQPGRFTLVHFQTLLNRVNEAYSDPVALTQKHARFLRLSALREKRMLMHPHIELNTVGCPEINNSMVNDRFNSNPGEEEGGLPILQSCVREHKPQLIPQPQFISTQEHEPITSNEVGVKQFSPKVSKGIYVGVADDVSSGDEPEIDNEDENLADMWKAMEFAMESCKEFHDNQVSNEVEEEDDNCDHSYILKDDIGYVCRVCGLVQKDIQDMYEFVYRKRTNTNSYYQDQPRNLEDYDSTAAIPEWYKSLGSDEGVTEVSAHEKHIKQMKPHQMEGFNFLLRNLVTDNPHGCILAHAPGSGKTFMLICFLQSYLAKYPLARPLVILPKGILGTWKKEFQRWKLDDIPLHDFYTVKASNRTQQLNVLKQWAEQKSILFIGYQHFSSIVAGDASRKEKVACREILLGAPTVLILDEGHTPRNKNTDILHSLTQVKTPRKVVLSGTLYQNHVQEVFNILNLVQPRFLKLERNHAIVRRIMSKVDMSGIRKQLIAGAGDSAFYDLVENTLINDNNEQRKLGIIKDLREMTSRVLHYYKGDSFDELPGLVDFTILLNLSPQQKAEVDEMKRLKEKKFKCNSLGSAIYVHPELKKFSRSSTKTKSDSTITTDEEIDQMIRTLNLNIGVKAMFFLNLLRLCEISKEKLLVFSQYLLPLKFLERLAVHERGWTVGKEIFMITGESSTEHRDWSMEQFNNSPKARVFFGSIKACGEGISLVGASRILILDVHLNPSVSWQAVCRAFRPGQKKKVFTYRLVAGDSPEEEDHSTCFKKEIIAKMWFEWDGHSKKGLVLESINVEDCSDEFLLKPLLRKDIKALYKR